ncbi:nuclear transport factor 2 family protein [Thioalkalivibrio sp. XN279]|uniref:nuclear transport factor 2 family protein n=1 Tax=Thioalkalivibrio sp. XN279 TaxID=2714953 RepID=UPI00197DA590
MSPVIAAASAGEPATLARFREAYQVLDRDHLHLLDAVYAPQVVFEDPLHRIEGLDALRDYFARMYQGVESIRFDFGTVLHTADEAMLTWTMHMRHRRLRPGESLALPGATHVRFGDQVHYHRDYFDAGALLYERLPLLGSVVRAVRSRV